MVVPTAVWWNTVVLSSAAVVLGAVNIWKPELLLLTRDTGFLERGAPWMRLFGAQAIAVGSLYGVSLLAPKLPRSFFETAAIARFVWAACASSVLLFHGGPWNTLAVIVSLDMGSALHLQWALAQTWPRADREATADTKPDRSASVAPRSLDSGAASSTAGVASAAEPSTSSPQLWRGPYMSGLLHLAFTLAVAVATLVDPSLLPSLTIGVLARNMGDALIMRPGQSPDEAYARLLAVFATVVALYYARHGPAAFRASVASRLVLVAGLWVAAWFAIRTGDADTPAVLTATALFSVPSILSVPLGVIEHLTLAGTIDTVSESLRREAKLD